MAQDVTKTLFVIRLIIAVSLCNSLPRSAPSQTAPSDPDCAFRQLAYTTVLSNTGSDAGPAAAWGLQLSACPGPDRHRLDSSITPSPRLPRRAASRSSSSSASPSVHGPRAPLASQPPFLNPAATSTSIQFYVSASSGSDKNPGTFAQPFQTLNRAKVAVRNARQTSPTSAVTVLIRQGTYYETLLLSPEDGGSSQASVTWEAYSGRTPAPTWLFDSSTVACFYFSPSL